MKTKRSLSLLLCVAMLFSTLVFPAYAESAGVSVTFAAQKDGAFLIVPQSIEVKDGIAEEYGYTVKDGITSPTFLDALVAAHKVKYGDAFTKESAKNYLDVSDGGWILKSFTSAGGCGFTVNSLSASVSNEQIIKNGDTLEYYFYMDTENWSDVYTFFDTYKKNVKTGESFELTLNKTAYDSSYNPVTVPVDGTNENNAITINTVTSDGSISEPLDAVIDKDGKFSLKFDTEGTYTVTAQGFAETGSIIAPFCVVTAEKGDETSDFEAAVNTAYDEFSTKGTYNSAANTPLVFPLEYNSVTYTNLISYLKAWTFDKTGFVPEIEYKFSPSTTEYTDWRNGEPEKYIPNAFNGEGDATPNYFPDNKPLQKLFTAVKFKIGTAESNVINVLWAKTTSLERTCEEIVDYVASNLPFARIKGNNKSENEIVQEIGEASSTGKVGALPTADKLYTKASAVISWALENISGKSDALTLKNNKITVSRPEIGEDNAVFRLTATVTSTNDSSITKDVAYTLTVPAYEAVYIPVQVTSGAKLAIKNVDEKYIVKQDNAPEGYDLYLCALHTAANGAKQDYTYTAELENHITQSGKITVTGEDATENFVINLPVSSDDDTKLGTLEFLAPEIKSFDFDKDTTEYNIEINGAQSVKIAGNPAISGADVKITSYYSTLANANKGKLTVTGKTLDSKGVLCYLPDSAGNSVIKITVTAPAGSVQEQKTREYVINITKKSDTKPLTGLVITALSTENGKADSRANEETVTPTFVSGDNAGTYCYTVNYFRSQITVKPTAKGADIKVNGETVASGKVSNPINLEVGNNEIKIEVTLGGNTETYTVVVRRKAKLVITDVKLDNGHLSSLGNDRTGSCSFANNADKINVTYITNEPCDITVTAGDKVYTGTSGEPIEIDADGKDLIMPITKISHIVDGVLEEQNYVISFRRLAATSPSAVESYLPAPGQFVNVETYRNPDAVIASAGAITLGAFGGYAVYRYDEPIANDSKNPYGIDFIIYGNAFKNSDGSTSSGAAEPASVMVSKDGISWYELAGAKYYSADTRHNVSVTYTNGDETFTEASDTAWTSSDGENGVLPKNDYHTQPYYPNPSYYKQYQNGMGKNETFTAKTATFTGTMVKDGFYPFGYADSHSKNEELSADTAVNPYVKNHELTYNGDGFDISWAVDENGNKVELDEIRYIKIYNPTLSYGTSTGEKSPEITAVARSKADAEDVGITPHLSSLYINGKEVALEDGKFTYTVDAENADLLEFIPTAKDSSANIYVSDTRINSGEKCRITSVTKTRIIVQEGKKEPVIYIINLENVPSDNDNASLSAVEISPDGASIAPNGENRLSYSVPNNTAAIKLTPKTAGKKATVEISGKNLTNAVTLNNGEESAVIDLSVGENVFDLKVKSESGKSEKTYTLTITRKSGSSSTPSSSEITVSFTLTGDVIHYNKDTGRYTGNHKKTVWIKTQNAVIPKNSTVKYVTELMLNNAKIDFETNGVYISAINGIGEFDNGKNSGWMYRVNDVISNVGYADKKLSDGDVIEWFYTDDYTTEKNYEKWDDPKSATSKGGAAITGKTDKTDAATGETSGTFDENTFADVKKGDWYYDAVKYVYEKGIIKGTDKGFEPNADMSRAMLVTVLWRMENSPVVNFAMKFNDANDGWYTEAIRWAASEGIVSGISEDMFGTDEPITREMLTTILYRYAQKKNIDVSSGESTNILSYSDAVNVSEYAVTAMQWAIGEGIIKGESETLIVPDGKALRAQCAALIMRFCEKYSKQ